MQSERYKMSHKAFCFVGKASLGFKASRILRSRKTERKTKRGAAKLKEDDNDVVVIYKLKQK